MNQQIAAENSNDHAAGQTLAEISIDDVLLAQDERIRETYVPSTLVPRVVIGRIVAIDDAGGVHVDFAGNHCQNAIEARSTAMLDASAVGCEVALLFERGDFTKPIIMGVIYHSPAEKKVILEQSAQTTPGSSTKEIAATADGERVVISAEKEIELRCGKSSITLTRAGKIIIRGEYLLSRSSGVNRIKGGSVQIN